MRTVRIVLWLPLVAFVVFVGFVAMGLIKPDDTTHPSKLVGQPLPEFSLPASQQGKPGLATADLRDGKPHLVNIFASWCVPCAAEAPQLDQLAQAGVDVVGIAVRDRPDDTADFLQRYGDPYKRLGADDRSQVQLALGSSGVPETFLIDGRGRIVMQHVGDIRADEVDGIAAAWRAAK